MAIPNVSAWISISKASVLSMVSPLPFRLLGVPSEQIPPFTAGESIQQYFHFRKRKFCTSLALVAHSALTNSAGLCQLS